MNNSNNKTQDTNNLSHIPPNRYCRPPREITGLLRSAKNRKDSYRKYYGLKVIFIEKRTDLAAAVNRSKYLLQLRINSLSISHQNFKSLANLILLKTDLLLKQIRGYSYYCLPNIHPLQLKKALRSCKNPEPYSPQLKHLQHLFHLKSLTLHVENGSSMSKASKVIRKLRFLRSLHVKYLSDYDESDPNLPIKLTAKPIISDPDDKRGWGFFSQISKLPRLQRLVLQTSLRTLEGQSSVIQQDFADFYFASHKFKIDTEVYVSSDLDFKSLATKTIGSILKLADCLSIHLGVSKAAKKNPYTCQDIQAAELSEQENNRTLKKGEMPVKLYVLYKEKLHVNIGCLFVKCENMTSLYLKISGTEVFWDQNYENFPHKLQTVVLDLDFFGLKYEILDDRRPCSRFQIEEKIYEVSGQRKVKLHSGLLELLKQLKTRATGLETLDIFMCLANFKKSWYQPKDFKDLFHKILEEKTKEFFEELESFEKFHRIDLCKKDGYLDQCLNRTLAAKSLKMVQMRSCCNNL